VSEWWAAESRQWHDIHGSLSTLPCLIFVVLLLNLLLIVAVSVDVLIRDLHWVDCWVSQCDVSTAHLFLKWNKTNIELEPSIKTARTNLLSSTQKTPVNYILQESCNCINVCKKVSGGMSQHHHKTLRLTLTFSPLAVPGFPTEHPILTPHCTS